MESYRYTLGGFFLANYDDSPAGVFDEVDLLNWCCFSLGESFITVVQIHFPVVKRHNLYER